MMFRCRLCNLYSHRCKCCKGIGYYMDGGDEALAGEEALAAMVDWLWGDE